MLIIGGPVVRRLRFQDSRRQPVDRDQQMVSQCGEFDTCHFSSTTISLSDRMKDLVKGALSALR